jgi:thioredoxin 1
MNLTEKELEAKIQEGFTGVIDFYADWCGPCKAIAPLLEKIDQEQEGNTVYKINIEQEREAAVKHGVTSIPTLLFFKGGVVTKKHVGMTTKNAILQNLNS